MEKDGKDSEKNLDILLHLKENIKIIDIGMVKNLSMIYGF